MRRWFPSRLRPTTAVNDAPVFAYWEDTDHAAIASTIEEWRSHFPCGLPLRALKRLIGRLREFEAISVDRSPSPINTDLSSGWQIALGSPLFVGAISRQETGTT
jgi:hypothetical protein